MKYILVIDRIQALSWIIINEGDKTQIEFSLLQANSI